MKRYTDEDSVESDFIDKINRLKPAMAWHNLTTKEGYPDVTVVGPHLTLVEVKHDRSEKGSRLLDMMEPSQPVLMHDMAHAGFTNTFLLVYHKGVFTMYSTDGILLASMSGQTASEGLKQLVASESIDVMVEYAIHRSAMWD